MAFIPIYILILFVTIIIDYIAGILIEDAKEARRKLLLSVSIVANLGILFFFKYFNFFSENVNQLFHISGSTTQIPLLHFILPIGLSFHTFQAMSYTIEVYRGNQKAERHFGVYALYVMFYPQLVAGPIERPQNVLHQFWEKHHFSYDNLVAGLRMMLWGLIKKSLIADRLALLIDPVYAAPHKHSSTVLVVATVFFTFQLYCDFSGYSDLAIGTARVMGFKLMTNFNRPYFSKNIVEFWQRWHISFSTWLRDYLFVPLGGSRVTKPRRIFNILFVFTLSGVWHGANWNYVMWGFVNGLFIVYVITTKKLRTKLAGKIGLLKFPKLNTVLNIAGTMTYIVFQRVIFRTSTLNDAVFVLRKCSGIFNEWVLVATSKLWNANHLFYNVNVFEIRLAIFTLVVFMWFEYISRKVTIDHFIGSFPKIGRWAFYITSFFILYFQGTYGSKQFIYFQF